MIIVFMLPSQKVNLPIQIQKVLNLQIVEAKVS